MVQLESSVASRIVELMVMFNKKGGFQLLEFTDAGGVFMRLSKVIEAGKPTEVSLDDIKFSIGTINVCSQRVPVEAANFRVIADLLDKLTEVIKSSDDEEETKASR